MNSSPRRRTLASQTALGLAHAAFDVRTLLADYTRQRNMREAEVGLILYGYLAARLGLQRLSREWPVHSGGLGRPKQVDFVVGRRRQESGEFEADSLIELAVAREGDPHGLSPSRNKTEIEKLLKTNAKHHVLLLVDLLDEHRATSLLDEYQNWPRLQGRPVSGKIRLIYVGSEGVKTRSIKRQLLA